MYNQKLCINAEIVNETDIEKRLTLIKNAGFEAFFTAYGSNLPDGVSNISISNVICNSKTAIRALGYLKDSCISNVINRNPDCPVILSVRPNGLINVKMSNLVSAGDVLVKEA